MQNVVEGDVERERTAENGGSEVASKAGRRSCRRRVWAEPHHRYCVDEEVDASTGDEDGIEAYSALQKIVQIGSHWVEDDRRMQLARGLGNNPHLSY